MEIISCHGKKHGEQSFELSLNYPLTIKGQNKKEKYQVTAYFFTPRQLKINSSRYKEIEILKKITSYTRFGTIKMSLSEINDLNNEKSPITRISKAIPVEDLLPIKNKKRILYELKNFTNYLLSGLTNQTTILKRLSKSPFFNENEIEKKSEAFLNQIKALIKSRAKVVELLMDAQAKDKEDKSINQSMLWAAESISIKIKKGLWKIWNSANLINNTKLKNQAIELLENEIEFCKKLNIPLLIEKQEINNYNEKNSEKFLKRENQLKKWSQQILYMSTAKTKKAKQLSALFFSIAASIAMATTIILTLLITSKFKGKNEIILVAAVFIYALKDRIKEGFRELALLTLPILISDRENKIIDPYSKKKSGITRERVNFIKKTRLPQKIEEIRFQSESELTKKMGLEDIIQYHKSTLIKSKMLTEKHPRLHSLKEILRIDMQEWFNEMDKAEEFLYQINNDKLEKIKAQRTYQINIVLKLNKSGKKIQPIWKHYKIIASRKKIIRVEPIKIN